MLQRLFAVISVTEARSITQIPSTNGAPLRADLGVAHDDFSIWKVLTIVHHIRGVILEFAISYSCSTAEQLSQRRSDDDWGPSLAYFSYIPCRRRQGHKTYAVDFSLSHFLPKISKYTWPACYTQTPLCHPKHEIEYGSILCHPRAVSISSTWCVEYFLDLMPQMSRVNPS